MQKALWLVVKRGGYYRDVRVHIVKRIMQFARAVQRGDRDVCVNCGMSYCFVCHRDFSGGQSGEVSRAFMYWRRHQDCVMAQVLSFGLMANWLVRDPKTGKLSNFSNLRNVKQ